MHASYGAFAVTVRLVAVYEGSPGNAVASAVSSKNSETLKVTVLLFEFEAIVAHVTALEPSRTVPEDEKIPEGSELALQSA